MGLRSYKHRLAIQKKYKKPLAQLEADFHAFKGEQAVAICPSVTEHSWQGVLSATHGLFGERVIQLPQYYSNTVYTESELVTIAALLSRLDSDHLVFSGYLPYFRLLIEQLHGYGKRVSVIYHGSHASVLEDESAALHFKELIELAKGGKLYKVGFVKKGLDKSFGVHTGIQFYPIHLITNEKLFELKANKYEELSIGVLTHDSFRKNLYNMVSAGLMVEGSIVHMKNKFNTGYFNKNDRIREHPVLKSHDDFLKVLGGMKVNLYVTYSECWGQFVNESLAMGVPCLTADVSAVLDFDYEMKKRLVVAEFDNDVAIYKKLMEVIEDLDWYRKNGENYIKEVNKVAHQVFKVFIG